MERYSDEQIIDVGEFLRHTLTRRRALQAGLVLGAGALAAACSNGGTNSGAGTGGGGAAAAPTPPSKGSSVPTPRNQTLVVDQGVFSVWDSFNPVIPNGEQYQAGVGQVAKEYLAYVNLATGQIQPWQATGWQYNGDFTQLTLTLDPAVHWNDGQAFTSQDVKYTLDTLKGNKTLLNRDYADEIDSVTAPDPQTVVVKLQKGDPRFHYHFLCMIVGSDFGPVLPQHVWSKHDPTSFKNNPPVYTGPYKLQKTDQTLQMYIWQKDPTYWNKARLDPAPGYVVYRNAPAPDAENQDFKTAVIDVGQNSNLYLFAKQMQAGGSKDVIITPMVDPCPRAVLFNTDSSKGVLAQPKFRQAVAALLDRHKIATTIWPIQAPEGVYPWPQYPNNTKWDNQSIVAQFPQTYDPQRAGQLLDEIGAGKGSDGKRSYHGKPISLQIITPGQSSAQTAPEYIVAQLLAQELQSQGIDASAKLLAGPLYTTAVQKGQYDIRSEWLCGEVLDPWQVFTEYNSSFYKPVGQTAQEGYDDVRLKDSTLDKAIDGLAKLSPDDPGAKALSDEALTEFFAQVPAIPYLQTVYTHQFNTTYWTGWPTAQNLYQVPNNWWGQFMFVIGQLKPSGR